MSEKAKRSKFLSPYWLVVIFEFFERASYYGVMSVLSVYLVDELDFAKQDVGLIKGTIQPLLYFLPIISGALADRFGYRRLLMIAFSLLGGGYFLVSQATDYTPVFLCLVVMGLGAGTFKPIISGTIARCTDETNNTLGFGIFYWSINLGALLFPLILVPILVAKVGFVWVLITAAICTGTLLLPTIVRYREPPKPKEDDQKAKTNLFQTIANAFEIIYSPFVLLSTWMQRSRGNTGLVVLLLVLFLGYAGWSFSQPQGTTHSFAARVYKFDQNLLIVKSKPNLCKAESYKLETNRENGRATLTLFKPGEISEDVESLLEQLRKVDFLGGLTREELIRYCEESTQKTILEIEFDSVADNGFEIQDRQGGRVGLLIRDMQTYSEQRTLLQKKLLADPRLAALQPGELDELADKADKHSFLLLFVGLLLGGSLVVLRLARRFQVADKLGKSGFFLGTMGALYLVIWLLPGLSFFARILSSVLSLTLLSLYALDYKEISRFKDHFRFLLMVVIYSGFWVLYFQMFDSVLWYVQAYVDPTALNDILSPIMNGLYSILGVDAKWRFGVEFVTAINAFTIVMLQFLVSWIVKNTKALPTMITGICLGTAGMAILAISTGIWVFLLGIIIFSIGEMTAHPKFIAYVGQIAPKSRVAMYMGYLFLYGVIGSSIGGVVGANLYVKYVDQLNQPRTLWLIFAGIGVATIVGLLQYNHFVGKKVETIEDRSG